MKKELSDLGDFLTGVLPEQHQPEAERLVNKLREAVELYVRELGGEHNRGIESSEGGSSQASQAGRFPGVQPPVSIGSVLTVQAERKDWDLNGKLAEASAGVRGDLSKDDGGVAQGAAIGSLKCYTKQWVWLKGEPMPWRADAVTVDQFDRLQRVVWNYPHIDDWDRAGRPIGYQGYRIMPNLFICQGKDPKWSSVNDARRAMEDKGWNDLPGLLPEVTVPVGYDPDDMDSGNIAVQRGWILINNGSSGPFIRTGLICYRKADKSLVYINLDGVRWYKSLNGQWLCTQSDTDNGEDGGQQSKYLGYKFWQGNPHASIEVAKDKMMSMPWEDVPSMVRKSGWIILEGSIWPETPQKAIVEFSKEGHLVKFHFLAHAMGYWWVLQQGKKGPELAFIDLVSGKYDNIPLPFIGYRFLEDPAWTLSVEWAKERSKHLKITEAPEWKEEE